MQMRLIINIFIRKVDDNTNWIFGIAIGWNTSLYGKECIKIPTVIGRFGSPDGLNCYSVFMFAFTFYNSHVEMKFINHFKEYE